MTIRYFYYRKQIKKRMAITRFKALELAQSRTVTPVKLPTEKVSDYYGSMTFSDEIPQSKPVLKLTVTQLTKSQLP